jgi:hypothetical protein
VNKNTLKYALDIALFIEICSVAVVGLLLAFVIPEGRSGPGEKYFLGLHRSGWEDIHRYLSLLFLVLLICHLALNWRWIVQTTKHTFGDKWKNALLVISGAWIIVLIIAWIVVN